MTGQDEAQDMAAEAAGLVAELVENWDAINVYRRYDHGVLVEEGRYLPLVVNRVGRGETGCDLTVEHLRALLAERTQLREQLEKAEAEAAHAALKAASLAWVELVPEEVRRDLMAKHMQAAQQRKARDLGRRRASGHTNRAAAALLRRLHAAKAADSSRPEV